MKDYRPATPRCTHHGHEDGEWFYACCACSGHPNGCEECSTGCDECFNGCEKCNRYEQFITSYGDFPSHLAERICAAPHHQNRFVLCVKAPGHGGNYHQGQDSSRNVMQWEATMHDSYEDKTVARTYTLEELAMYAQRVADGEDWNWAEICSPQNLLHAVANADS